MTKRAYVNPSICPCGYTLVRDDIPLGTLYETNEESLDALFKMKCGGCGVIHEGVEALLVKRPGSVWGYMPVAIFGEVQKEGA